MKICLSALRTLIRAVTLTVALVFIIPEGTLLFTGDFLLYEIPATAFLQLCLRLAIPAAAFVIALLSLLRAKHRFFFESLCLLTATVIIAPCLSNHIGWYLVLLAVLFGAANFSK